MDEAMATTEEDKSGYADARSKDAQNKDRKIGGIVRFLLGYIITNGSYILGLWYIKKSYQGLLQYRNLLVIFLFIQN